MTYSALANLVRERERIARRIKDHVWCYGKITPSPTEPVRVGDCFYSAIRSGELRDLQNSKARLVAKIDRLYSQLNPPDVPPGEGRNTPLAIPNNLTHSATPEAPEDAKWDGGKPQFDLLDNDCPLALLGVVQVATWAVEVKGYKPGSWQTVQEAIRRYGAAMRRHQNAKARGERYDAESGLLHDFHIATNAMFVAELEARVDRDKGLVQQYHKALPEARA